jgi:hypothetical protein
MNQRPAFFLRRFSTDSSGVQARESSCRPTEAGTVGVGMRGRGGDLDGAEPPQPADWLRLGVWLGVPGIQRVSCCDAASGCAARSHSGGRRLRFKARSPAFERGRAWGRLSANLPFGRRGSLAPGQRTGCVRGIPARHGPGVVIRQGVGSGRWLLCSGPQQPCRGQLRHKGCRRCDSRYNCAPAHLDGIGWSESCRKWRGRGFMRRACDVLTRAWQRHTRFG